MTKFEFTPTYLGTAVFPTASSIICSVRRSPYFAFVSSTSESASDIYRTRETSN